MKKQFKTNLGSTDAKAFGLDYKKCQTGSVVDLTADQVKAITAKYPLLLLDPDSEEAKEAREGLVVKAVAKDATVKGVNPPTPENFGNNPHDAPPKGK